MARCVVTGGGGFIGSHLVDALLKRGSEVVVIDNFSTGRRENLAPYAGQIALHEADLRDADAVHKACQGADYVLHQGALPSVPRSVADPLESNAVNVQGTLNVLLAARDAGVKRVVYAASSSAYGDADTDQKHEGLVPDPLSPYGVAKLTGEYYGKAFYHCYGLETVSLRYFNVFGPRQNPYSPYTGVLAIFIPKMLQGEHPVIFGDGTATRDFTYVQNTVEANLLALTAPEAPGESINLACGQRVSILQVVESINRILGTNFEPAFAPPREGDIQHSLADISKAERLLGYEPSVSFDEGLARTIEWYRAELGL